MSKIYYNKDADIKNIKKKTIAIIGYGSQGHAHARNLHDSGMKVMVGLRKGSAFWKRAQKDGLKVVSVPEAVKQADIMMILIPDDKQRKMYENDIAPHLKKGQAIAFGHGFNIHFGQNWDIHWHNGKKMPTEKQYIQMIINKFPKIEKSKCNFVVDSVSGSYKIHARYISKNFISYTELTNFLGKRLELFKIPTRFTRIKQI